MGGAWEINAGELILAGGPIMIPIGICSIIAVGIILGKLIYFASISSNPNKLKHTVFTLIKNNKIKDAIAQCDQDPSPLAQILKAGILQYGASRETIKEAMEDVSLFEIPKLEKRFTALATIAHIAPLLGLFGTVTGMTRCFYTIKGLAETMNPVTPGELAGGIGEALLTTVAGLTVAIPTFVVYNYLVSRVNTFILDMERGATELVNLLCHINETSTSSTHS